MGGFGFTGEQTDPETGFVYLRARSYDPATSRFLTPDPLGLVGSGVNLYAYAGNSPVRATDPSGLAGDIGGGLWGVGGGGAGDGGAGAAGFGNEIIRELLERALRLGQQSDATPSPGSSLSEGASCRAVPILADTSLLVAAFGGNTAALNVLRAGKTLVAPEILQEFLNVKESDQRLAFFKREGLVLFDGPFAVEARQRPEFRETFQKGVRGGQSVADATLIALAKATGIEAVTADNKLYKFVNDTLRDPSIPVRYVPRY